MAEVRTKRALVVGLGIAGMSAAIGLRQAGWTPVIVERSPERRTGGYFIGVFPEGKKAAADLGALEHLHVRNPDSGTPWNIDRSGRAHAGSGFLDRPGGPYAVVRGDIEAALWRTMQGDPETAPTAPVEIRYATTPLAITDKDELVSVVLSDTRAGTIYVEDFDLVVGADGLRSTVREIAFGSHSRFIQKWDAIICAAELDGQVPGFGPQDSVTDAQAGRAAWVFGFADRTPTVLLTYRTKDVDAQFARPRIDALRAAYSGMDRPAVQHALASLEGADQYLFDSAAQVRMPSWRKGRVIVLGDAAWCLTLYSGMGASSAMRGGAALGQALNAHPDDLQAALKSWERGLRPFITKHSRLARLMQQFFVPSGPMTSAMRTSLLRFITRLGQMKSRSARTATADSDRSLTSVG